ncbi:hypothetical protein BIW11_08283 [Tropilaelaps mercedesae]|uniref:Elongator complex protein 5 n=1 Tax=Tropilaelaps mercedesae TaxID=418985 RepID=A0A1V9XQ78_9ACAR|nr:hypothetical protein BIW11_08283 [Tropilaelaps mercedesae]
MAEQILDGQDIRGLFLIIEDSQQNALVLLKLYCEKLKIKNYNLQIFNASRPDILQPTDLSVAWPPVIDKVQSTVLVLHGIELLLALGGTNFERFVRDALEWLSRDNVSQVVCVVNRELTDANEMRKLEYICCQRLDILSRKADLFIVETLWKKPRGKAIVQKEELDIAGGTLVKGTVIKDVCAIGETPRPTVSVSDMLAGLTFNVNTSGEEKKEKDQLVLPYTEAGEINYTLDRDDDFDEEDDPDDDLNI